ncbi:hypothetical protein MCJ35_31065 [Enterocloster sp. OA13]|uniref:hypothetical protein n=1 Tax=Enterocloster sp. OA13 TaxID=2914161 RepID=UPI000470B74F|nr:hypothetical protein [Enterocloster sp. OA13]
MYNPKEELQAILDLLGEWRNRNGIGYVTMCILDDGFGTAYDYDGHESMCVVTGEYGGGNHGDSDMQDMPVQEPVHGVQPDDTVPVIQKMYPDGWSRQESNN